MSVILAFQEADKTAPVKSGSGKFKITLLKAGQGSKGYYPADVIKRDGPTVFPEGTHVYLDHPTETEKYDRPERSVRDLAGTLSGPSTWDESSQSLVGTMQIVPLYADLVENLAPHVGMSIRVLGYAQNEEVGGVMVNKISQFVHAESVDIVTRAGAGGKIVSMIESARNAVPTIPPVPVGPPNGRNNMELTKEELAGALMESNKTLLAGLVEALKPAAAPAGDPLDAVLGLSTALATSGLNEAAQKLVIESVRHGAKPSEAIEAHKAALGVAPVVQQAPAVVPNAYGQLVAATEASFGLGFGEANAGGNRAAIVGGAVVGEGQAAGQPLSEAEHKDWESTIQSLVGVAPKGRGL